MDFKDPKTYGRIVLGGGITILVGGFVLPYTNTWFSFIPQTFALGGVTLHQAIAYGVGFTLGTMANDQLLK